MQESLSLLVSKWSFFQELLIQHIEISLIAIVVAIVVGGISESPDQ
jgi:osmoprotectant transport system permease protein